jgi:hypothetical protein
MGEAGVCGPDLSTGGEYRAPADQECITVTDNGDDPRCGMKTIWEWKQLGRNVIKGEGHRGWWAHGSESYMERVALFGIDQTVTEDTREYLPEDGWCLFTHAEMFALEWSAAEVVRKRKAEEKLAVGNGGETRRRGKTKGRQRPKLAMDISPNDDFAKHLWEGYVEGKCIAFRVDGDPCRVDAAPKAIDCLCRNHHSDVGKGKIVLTRAGWDEDVFERWLRGE